MQLQNLLLRQLLIVLVLHQLINAITTANSGYVIALIAYMIQNAYFEGLFLSPHQCRVLSLLKIVQSNQMHKWVEYVWAIANQDQKSGEMIGRARMLDCLYYFEEETSGNKKVHGLSSISSSPDKETILLWHRRLGHPNFLYLKYLFPDLFKGIDCSTFHCEACILAKNHRNTYLSKPYKASKPFYLIHSDVWGPSKTLTHSGKRWFVTFIDDHTRLTWVYLLTKKSDVQDIFIRFYNMIENQFQTKISILHTDNGTEYFNAYLDTFFKNKGIFHQSTCRDTPQQNGIAERKNRHIDNSQELRVKV